MHRRITRTAVLILALAFGYAGASAAHPSKPRGCGSLGVKVGGMPTGAVVVRGATKCVIARKVLRRYLRSKAPCDGSACVRDHFGWTCASAKAPDWPRVASCVKGRAHIEASNPAD